MRALLPLLLCLALAGPAAASSFRCKEWEKRDDAGKEERIAQRITEGLEGNAARQYGSINKVAVRRCLEGRIWDLREQFDYICSEGQRRSMQALDEEFERTVWTCVAESRR